MTPELEAALRALIEQAKHDAYMIDGEWGMARTYEQLVADGDTHALRIVAAEKALNEITEGTPT